jgi:hypothetical protein
VGRARGESPAAEVAGRRSVLDRAGEHSEAGDAKTLSLCRRDMPGSIRWGDPEYCIRWAWDARAVGDPVAFEDAARGRSWCERDPG